MRPSAPFVALLLSLILAVTGQGMALARGQTPAEGWMVLCTGQGAIMIFTDAEGRPTSPPQLCADGAQSLFAHSLPPPVAELRPAQASGTRHAFHPVMLIHADRPPLSARDPPDL